MISSWIAAFFFVYLSAARRSCRCLYGEPCWPSESDFKGLATQLSHPLIYPTPPESACYPAASPSGNCTDVLSNTLDGNWRADQAGSMQSINFETYTFSNGTISACYLNTSLGISCEQGSVPVIGVDAHTVEDVQAAVKFAHNHNLYLVVKNTGHDFLGRSAGRGSFLLWTHHLKNVTYDASFVPSGAAKSENYKALTLGAGIQWHEAYDAAEAHGRFVVGGLSAGGSVGAAGGWVLGGGHSAFSPRHGLGVDNAIEFTMVTSTGEVLTVNSHKYPDLFWALRGGGGGTYGVLTSVTYRTHDSVPLTGVLIVANFSTPVVAKTVLTEFVRINPALADAGWGGYAFVLSNALTMVYVAPNISVADANATIDPFVSFASNATHNAAVSYLVSYDSFYSLNEQLFATGQQVGTNLELGSRLIPRKLIESNSTEVADSLLDLKGGVLWHLVAGGAVSKIDPDTTGLNPAWREAVAHIAFSVSWAEGDSAGDINKLIDTIKASLDKWEALSPGAGAYFNEASLYERDPKFTFFGSHYKRLEAIKEKYDPYGLFIVAKGVGYEKWDDQLRCKIA